MGIRDIINKVRGKNKPTPKPSPSVTIGSGGLQSPSPSLGGKYIPTPSQVASGSGSSSSGRSSGGSGSSSSGRSSGGGINGGQSTYDFNTGVATDVSPSGKTTNLRNNSKNINNRITTQIDLRNKNIQTKETYNPQTRQFEIKNVVDKVVDKIKDAKIGNKYIVPRPLEPIREQVQEFKKSEIDLTEKEKEFLRRESSLKITEEELEKETRGLTVYLGDKVEDGMFTGTEAEYKVYQDKFKDLQKQEQLYFKEFENYEKKFGEYEGAFEKREDLSTIKVGLIGGGRDRNILEFSKVEERPISTAFKYFEATVGETAGAGTQNFLERKGKKDVSTLKFFAPQSYLVNPAGPVILQAGIKSGFIPETITTEQAGRISGKVAEKGVGLGKYFVPTVGSAVFATEVGEFGREATKTYRTTGQLTPELKREGIVLGAMVATAGALKGVQYLRTPLIRETATGFRISNRWNEFAGTKLRFSKPSSSGIGIKTDYLPSQRGTTIDFFSIKKPTADVKASEIIGIDTGKQIFYPEQIIQQSSISGKGTRVMKDGKLIYEGLPIDKLGREKAFNLLEGTFGTTGTTNILRYSAPKITRVKIKESVLNYGGKTSTGTFNFIQEQPRVILNRGSILDRLIETRGARQIKTTIEVDRTLLAQKGRIGLASEESTSMIINYPKKNIVNLKGFEFKKGVSFAKGSEPVQLNKNIMAERIDGVSISTYFPRDKNIFVDTGRTTLLKTNVVEGNIGFKGGGQKSSQEFFEQLYSLKQTPQVIAKPLKTVPSSSSAIKFQTPESSSINVKETLTSTYAGTGLYERTEDVSVMNIPSQTITMQPRNAMVERQEIIQSPKISTNTKVKLFEPTRELTKQPTKQFSDIKTDTTQRTQPKQRTGFKQVFETLQKSRQTTKTTQPIKPNPTPKTKVKTPFKNILKSMGKEKKSEGVIEVFTRKKGEDISLGKVKTKEEAKELLRGTLKGTLRASGFATIKGQKTFLDLGEGFGRSKLDSFRSVQSKTARFGTRSETREAQSKRKSKKNSWGF